jgi:hypothetical protein
MPYVRLWRAERSEPTRNQPRLTRVAATAQAHAPPRTARGRGARRRAPGTRGAIRRSGRAGRTSPRPARRGTPGGRGTAAGRPRRCPSPGGAPRSSPRSRRRARRAGSPAARCVAAVPRRRSARRGCRGSGIARGYPRVASRAAPPVTRSLGREPPRPHSWEGAAVELIGVEGERELLLRARCVPREAERRVLLTRQCVSELHLLSFLMARPPGERAVRTVRRPGDDHTVSPPGACINHISSRFDS